MLVYDITNQKSFDNITNWIEAVEEVSKIVVLLCYVWACGVRIYMSTLVYG